MTPIEAIILQLGEECAEVAQQVSKTLRFGLNDVYEKQPELGTNRDRLMSELNDVRNLTLMLVECGVLPSDNVHPSAFSNPEFLAKKAKVLKYIAYGKSTGAIAQDNS